MNKCTSCGETFSGNVCPNCGQTVAAVEKAKMTYPSTFDGGAIENGLRNLAVFFASLFTLSIAYPFMICWKLRWKCSHTYINGRRLKFDGTGEQLIGNYLVWFLLSVITLGIYFIVAGKLNIVKWQAKHTHFEHYVPQNGKEEIKSEFTGHWYQLFGVNFVSNIVSIITLGLGRYWAHCYKERWYAKHKIIDGHSLYFTGTAFDYFKKCFLWTVLTVITLGIYSFWLSVKSLKWTTECTHIENAEALPAPNSECKIVAGNVPKISDKPKKAEKPPKPKKPVNVLGIVGLVLSCTGYFPVGVVLSILGLKKSKDMEGSGKKISIAGIIISALFAFYYIFIFIIIRTV